MRDDVGAVRLIIIIKDTNALRINSSNILTLLEQFVSTNLQSDSFYKSRYSSWVAEEMLLFQ